MSRKSQGVPRFNARMWNLAWNEIQILNDYISAYVRAYAHTHETLNESFLTKALYSKPFLLLRQGTAASMLKETKEMYKQILGNANAFNRIFDSLALTARHVLLERIPSDTHTLYLRSAFKGVNSYRYAIQKLIKEIKSFQPQILNIERYYGMISSYHPPRIDPPHVDNWFPVIEGVIKPHSWYRMANYHLLEALRIRANALSNRFNEQIVTPQMALLRFIEENYDTLEKNIPNFNSYTGNMVQITNWMKERKEEIVKVQQDHSSPLLVMEEKWREHLYQTLEKFERDINILQRTQSAFLNMFKQWKEQYLASGDEELLELCRQFEIHLEK